VLPATIVLLNKLPSIPERERGMWDLVEPRTVVGRVVLRLLRHLPEQDDVLQLALKALPEI